jgi:hypothetical protein
MTTIQKDHSSRKATKALFWQSKDSVLSCKEILDPVVASMSDDVGAEQALTLADSYFVDEMWDDAIDAYTVSGRLLERAAWSPRRKDSNRPSDTLSTGGADRGASGRSSSDLSHLFPPI